MTGTAPRPRPAFIDALRARAGESPCRIGFPEADEARTAEAMRRLDAAGWVKPVAVGPGPAEIGAKPAGVGMESADVGAERAGVGTASAGTGSEPAEKGRPVGTRTKPLDGGVASAETGAKLAESAGEPGRGANLAEALRRLADGELDGVVAGAVHTTAEVIRGGLNVVGLAPGTDTVSAAFYMVLPPPRERVLTLVDAAVVPRPTPAQMAESAWAACTARRRIVGDEPVVAFLSYSTHGSAGGAAVDQVREAAELFRARHPDIPSDGELQADAALVPEVGARKAPGSPAAGRANVLVFPNLDAANIAYKLIERLAGARALGPILQGLRRPLNDLSRGASVSDIVDVACVTALISRGSNQ